MTSRFVNVVPDTSFESNKLYGITETVNTLSNVMLISCAVVVYSVQPSDLAEFPQFMVLSVLASASYRHRIHLLIPILCEFTNPTIVLTHIFFSYRLILSGRLASTKSIVMKRVTGKMRQHENKCALQNVSKPIWHLSHTLFSLKLQTLSSRAANVHCTQPVALLLALRVCCVAEHENECECESVYN